MSGTSFHAAFLALVSTASPVLGQEELRKPSIAVLPFRMSELQQHRQTIHLKESEVNLLTDRFLTALVQTRKFDVVEREKLESVLKEMDLTKSGFVDPKRGVQVGKMVGAEYLLTGAITGFSGNVSYDQVPYTKRYAKTISGHIAVELRLIRTETGVIAGAKSETYDLEAKDPLSDSHPRNGEPVPAEFLEELQKGIVDKLVQSVVDTCYPIKVILLKDEIAYLNRGEGGGLAVGNRLTAYLTGEALVDPDTGELLGSSETPLAQLEVIEVAAKSTKARIIKWVGEKHELPKGTLCRREANVAKPEAAGADKPKNPN